MVIRKPAKRKWRRGHRTYHGSHKKWRGGGSRGGRGEAGKHKHKWTYVVKYEKDHFGKHGFVRPEKISRPARTITLYQLDEIARRENKKEIDATSLGFEKVLGTGKISAGLVIKAKSFAKIARKKIEAAGGKAVTG